LIFLNANYADNVVELRWRTCFARNAASGHWSSVLEGAGFLSRYQQSATSEGGFDAAEKAGCSIGGGSTAVASICSPLSAVAHLLDLLDSSADEPAR
jgi:hypothetical protein